MRGMSSRPINFDNGTSRLIFSVLKRETGLDFDRLILLGTGEGTATLRPDGSRSVSGVVGDIGSRAMVGSAVVRGELYVGDRLVCAAQGTITIVAPRTP